MRVPSNKNQNIPEYWYINKPQIKVPFPPTNNQTHKHTNTEGTTTMKKLLLLSTASVLLLMSCDLLTPTATDIASNTTPLSSTSKSSTPLLLKTTATPAATSPMTGYTTPSPNRVAANSTYSSSYPAWKAFDQASNWTQWISKSIFPNNGSANIMYLFQTAQPIYEYTLRGRYDTLKNRLPKNWVLQASFNTNPSVNEAIASSQWFTIDRRSNITLGDEWNSTTASATATFKVAAPGNYPSYRICVSAVNGSSVVDLIEISLHSKMVSLMIPAQAGDGRTESNSEYQILPEISSPVWHLFDQSPYWTQWLSKNVFPSELYQGPFSAPVNALYHFDTPQTVFQYTLKGRYDQHKTRLPKDWLIQGSNTPSASASDVLTSSKWTTVDTRSTMGLNDDAAWNSTTNSAELTLPIANPGSFKTYRICVTHVNGASMVDLIELTFMGFPQN